MSRKFFMPRGIYCFRTSGGTYDADQESQTKQNSAVNRQSLWGGELNRQTPQTVPRILHFYYVRGLGKEEDQSAPPDSKQA